MDEKENGNEVTTGVIGGVVGLGENVLGRTGIYREYCWHKWSMTCNQVILPLAMSNLSTSSSAWSNK